MAFGGGYSDGGNSFRGGGRSGTPMGPLARPPAVQPIRQPPAPAIASGFPGRGQGVAAGFPGQANAGAFPGGGIAARSAAPQPAAPPMPPPMPQLPPQASPDAMMPQQAGFGLGNNPLFSFLFNRR